ncbi:hypothetical protein HGQ17_10225 [Nesterenkonia sp. MY13]|uniref:Solute-binding protein family 5 domain-containing protein n=1 Tax=Nesterenkonia sedimenti TaxID=1463632 RepID=A0A7X8YEI5_9MICC|nr:ABC transporter substrate-binding protein [Nesterenkonia sedimenti]NLS10361.1 hypothetical protein [Nesterenkonia sedimenti]
MPTTASVTRNTSMLMYEPPLVLDADGEVQPMLAEDYEMSEDNTVLTLTMREDVPFHNGETMTVDDVVASLERWAEVSNLGVDYFSEAEIEAVDEQTVTITLVEPMALAPVMLVEPAQLPMIMPAEILDDLDEASTNVEEHIGTGPYQWGEWVADQYIVMERFEDYATRDEDPSGLAGAKSANFEEIIVHFVSDSSTRINGLNSGEYDWIESVPYDNTEMIEDNPETELISGEAGPAIGVFNKAEGPLADETMREAVMM